MTYTNSISHVWGILLPQRLLQKVAQSSLCWKSCPSGLSVRYTDFFFFLYLWKEGREELILVNHLWQTDFCVYVRGPDVCVYLEGRKEEKKIILDYILKLQIPVYVSTYLWIYACPFIVSFSEIGYLFLNSQGFLCILNELFCIF